MYNEVYIDAVFAANLFVDYLLLRLTATYLRVPVSRKRTLLAAASGALFSCFLLYVQTGMILPLRISLQTGCAIFMVYVLCGPISAERLLQGVLSLYLGAFVLGGLWEAFFSGRAWSGAAFFAAGLLTFAVLRTVLCLTRFFREKTGDLYPVTLSWRGRTETLCGLFDTGNVLMDPLRGRPVSIVEADALRSLLSGEVVEKLIHLKEKPGELKSTQLTGLHPHFLICRTAGGSEEMLLAVTLDELCIQTPTELVHVANPVFALLPAPSALGKEYRVLINSRLIH